MRKVAIAVLVLAFLGVAIDALARSYVEGRVASEIADSFDLEDAPDVSLEGWPFIVHLVRGRLTAMSVSMEELSGRVDLERVEIRLRGITFSLGEVASGSPAVRVRRGSGEAVISQRALNDALRDRPGNPSVRLEGNRAFVSARALGQGVESSVVVEGDRLLVVASDAAPPFEIDLPDLPGRLSYESVEIAQGSLRLSFGGRDTTLASSLHLPTV